MALGINPIPITTTGLADGIIIASSAAPQKYYVSLPAGSYTISCVSTTVAYAYFYVGTTEVVRASTTSGTTTVAVTQDCTAVILSINTGTNVSVNVAQTGSTRAGSTGTVQIFTTNGNLAAGNYYTVVMGGGGGGGNAPGGVNGYVPGGGGGSGGITCAYLSLNTTTAYTVGAGGNINASGGASSISNLTANGGTGGNNGASNTSGTNGTAGTPNGIAGTGATQSYISAPATYTYHALTGNSLTSYGYGGRGSLLGNSGGGSGVAGGSGAIYVLNL